MTVLAREELTSALRDVLLSISGVACGVGSAPPPAVQGEGPELPYNVLYPLYAGGWIGGANLAETDAECWYQVTTVGEHPTQVEALGDEVRRLFLDIDPVTGLYVVPLNVPGLNVWNRTSTGPGGLDVNGAVVSVAQRFQFYVQAR